MGKPRGRISGSERVNPAVTQRSLRPARRHLLNPHRHRPRRINKSHHRHLNGRDEQQNQQHNQNPFPSPPPTACPPEDGLAVARGCPFYAVPRLARFRFAHRQQQTAPATRLQPFDDALLGSQFVILFAAFPCQCSSGLGKRFACPEVSDDEIQSLTPPSRLQTAPFLHLFLPVSSVSPV